MASFPERLSFLLNGSCVAFALSLAKDTGILQALIDAKEGLTSEQIAREKNLKERYVREILASLGTAEFLHIATNEAGTLSYFLEDDEKKALSSALTAFISFPKVFGHIYDQVRACVPADGPFGVRYSERVHDVIDEFTKYLVDGFTDSILKHTDGLQRRLETGIDVIEFGSGRGRLLSKFATMFPNSTFTVSEILPELLDTIRARWSHIPNIKYELVDLCSLPDVVTKQYDWLFCCDVIHDLPNPFKAVEGIQKLVKAPDGVFTFIDMATSGSPVVDRGSIEVAAYYAAGTFLCIPESFQRPDSLALGPCWGQQKAVEIATLAGFKVKDVKLESGHQAIYICTL
ncbi:unnamed protein product [Lymnaea stagnalis]|uniref:Methyltransferase domain-containing protein n=1 Tax=Lymnaea stagnalis TaxID=6523 RepID=A0AAV2I3E8_LYMST